MPAGPLSAGPMKCWRRRLLARVGATDDRILCWRCEAVRPSRNEANSTGSGDA